MVEKLDSTTTVVLTLALGLSPEQATDPTLHEKLLAAARAMGELAGASVLEARADIVKGSPATAEPQPPPTLGN